MRSKQIARFLRDQNGATAIEYGLIVALIVIGIMASLTLFADTAISMWNRVSSNVAAVSNP